MASDANDMRSATNKLPSPCDSDGTVRASYDEGGIAAVDAILARDGYSDESLARLYLTLSKALHPADPKGCRDAARRAFAFDPSVRHRKWLGFRTYDADDVGEAWALIKVLPADTLLTRWEKRQRDTILRRVKTAPSTSNKGKKSLELFRQGGTDLVISDIFERNGQDALACARELVRIGKLLLKAGHPEAEAPLMAEAVRQSRNKATLRAYHYAALRRNDLSTAIDCVSQLEMMFSPEPSKQEIELLKKMKRHPNYLLSFLTQIPPRSQKRIASIPKRLCYVLHNSLPYSSSGYATRSQGFALGLLQNGWDVRCVTRPGFPLDMEVYRDAVKHKEPPRTELHDGVTYHRIAKPTRLDSTKYDYLNQAADVVMAILQELRPEVVMAASDHMTGIPALIAARRLGLPFLYEVRGLWEITRMSREPAFAERIAYQVDVSLGASLCNAADHVFTLTGQMREELSARGVTTSITLLPNSCDITRFEPRPPDVKRAQTLGIPVGTPVIGYVGSIVQYEGLDDLTRACAMLAARGLDFRLLLVGNEPTSGPGEGPVTLGIRRTAQETGVGDRLIMTGRVPHEEVESYYSLIDIAPFPRKPQPVTELVSPIKPLEALAMEKAVVVSSVRALAEMIEDGVTGLVFEKGSVDDLADTLERLITDSTLRARLGKAGRAWVEQERTWRSTARLATTHLQRVQAAYQSQ